MFGKSNRKKAAPQRHPEQALYEREEIRAVLEEWAEGLKKPYQAAGFDLEAAISHVDGHEAKASGSTGHPWPAELKIRMVQRIKGADSLPEVKKRIQELQLGYERGLAASDDQDEEA